jgi:hypothetical protein
VAILAMHDINNIHLLSMETAVALFKMKIRPIIAYGLDLTWEFLTTGDLRRLDNIKATFLKRLSQASKFTSTRLIYELYRETLFVEDLRLEMLLPSTAAVEQHLWERALKRNYVWEDFFTTEAMLNRDWTKPNYELRHVTTRMAIHGFHHKICSTKQFHSPDYDAFNTIFISSLSRIIGSVLDLHICHHSATSENLSVLFLIKY